MEWSTRVELLEITNLLLFSLKHKSLSDQLDLCKELVDRLNYLENLTHLSLVYEDNDSCFAAYVPREKKIILNKKLFLEKHTFILEILLHEWAHHWNVETNPELFYPVRYLTIDEFDKLHHNSFWEKKLEDVLYTLNLPKMEWIPLYKRKSKELK